MANYTRVIVGIWATVEAAYHLFVYIKQLHMKIAEIQRHSYEVIFFPDEQPACKEQFILPRGCEKENCRFAHSGNSLCRVFSYLTGAEKTLDICVYTITNHALSDIVVAMKEKGIVIRVVTDSREVDTVGSQIGKFRKHGIQVRCDCSSYFMHHKFVIVDGNLLLNGSFNWSGQAVVGNRENLIATTDPKLVQPFQKEFDVIWKRYDPKAIQRETI